MQEEENMTDNNLINLINNIKHSFLKDSNIRSNEIVPQIHNMDQVKMPIKFANKVNAIGGTCLSSPSNKSQKNGS